MPLPVSTLPLAGKIAATTALTPAGWVLLGIGSALAVKIATQKASLKHIGLKAGPFTLNAEFQEEGNAGPGG